MSEATVDYPCMPHLQCANVTFAPFHIILLAVLEEQLVGYVPFVVTMSNW